VLTPGNHSVLYNDPWRFFYRSYKSSIQFFLLSLILSFFYFSNVHALATDISNQNLLNEVQRKYGIDAKKRVNAWLQLIQEFKNKPELDKLKATNEFLDQLEFKMDLYGLGKDHYWATPLEFLERGAGDCEEFAITKYFTLKYMGVSEEKLRIAYVKAIDLNRAHMVLAYYQTPSAEPLILDNLILAIKPASERPNLLPVYTFNGAGLWLAKERLQGARVSGSERLSLWRNLNARMAKETID
jgi:predicted transglutaminase-like cysteine proteinase